MAREAVVRELKLQKAREAQKQEEELKVYVEDIEKKKTAQENTSKDLTLAQEQITAGEQKIEDLKKAIEKYEGIIQKQDKEINILSKGLPSKEEAKRKLQDEADRYALLKYLQYLNIYSALPNADFDYHQYLNNEHSISTLSPSAASLTIDLMNQHGNKVAQYNVREAVNRETKEFNQSNQKALKDLFEKGGRYPK